MRSALLRFSWLVFFAMNLAAGGLAAPTEAPAGGTTTVTLDVRNMECRLCPITIRKALARVDGVTRAEVDYDTKTATVTFDPSKAGIDALTAATGTAGYPSSPHKD